jgi:hypothetical protein
VVSVLGYQRSGPEIESRRPEFPIFLPRPQK